MSRAIAVPIRQQMVELHLAGQSYAAIARQLQQSSASVRQICRRYRPGEASCLQPHYENCGRHGQRSEVRIWRAAVYLKRRHRHWGAGYIQVLLRQRWPEAKLPTVRTMQRWFRAAQVALPVAVRPTAPRARAAQVHQCWQVDAISHQPLRDGSFACWLSVTDEASGALLASSAFPLCRL
jgi:hypothetical protein